MPDKTEFSREEWEKIETSLDVMRYATKNVDPLLENLRLKVSDKIDKLRWEK